MAARAAAARTTGDPHSPWHAVDPWWPASAAHAIGIVFADGDARREIAVRRAGERLAGDVADARDDGARHRAMTAGSPSPRQAPSSTPPSCRRARSVTCSADGAHRKLLLIDPLAHAGEDEAHGGHLMAPMSGTVVAVMVKAGDKVATGAPLLILEAMKMEHTIAAPAAGVVRTVNYRAGDRVTEGADLVDIDDA